MEKMMGSTTHRRLCDPTLKPQKNTKRNSRVEKVFRSTVVPRSQNYILDLENIFRSGWCLTKVSDQMLIADFSWSHVLGDLGK